MFPLLLLLLQLTRVCITSTTPCQDNPTFDCQRVSALLNLCADIQHAKTVCRKFCGLCDLVVGGWSAWSSWTPCSRSCGVGLQTRDRSCSNPYLQCRGDNKVYRTCFDRSCSGTNGAWSTWSSWGTCDGGLQSRNRTCTNPVPSWFGRDCHGNNVDKQLCINQIHPDKAVAFSVHSPNGSLSSNNNPIFAQSLVNTGSYNQSTGEFTCPVAGIYSFSATLRSSGSSNTSEIYCYFRVNDVLTAFVESYRGAWDTSSATTVVTLNVGDVVDLDCKGWEHVHHTYDTAFNGVLLAPT